MRKAIVATITVAAIALTSCNSAESELTDLAKETCNDLENAIVLQVGSILGSSISDAEDLGFTGPEFGDKMREECPMTMLALESLGEEQEARDKLPSQMRVSTSHCGPDGAKGSIKNNSDMTVDVWVSVQYLDAGGRILDDGLDSIDRIGPGEIATWEDKRYDDLRGVDKCRAVADSVYES